MTSEKYEKTFAQQMLEQLDVALTNDKAREFMGKAKNQQDPGMISRVFNELGLNLPQSELDTLLNARETSGWPAFSKAIAEQVEPIIDRLFYGEEPTLFDTFYNTHFAGTAFTREAVQSKLVSGIITQHGECATEAMSKAYPDDPFFLSDSINAINEVAKLIQTPDDIKASAHSTLSNPGPKAHIEKLQAVDQKKVAMLAINDISVLLADTINERKALQALKSEDPNVLKLISILTNLEESIGSCPLDPEDSPLEKSIFQLLDTLSDIQTKIDVMPTKEATPEFKHAQQTISRGVKEVKPLLEKNLQRLHKAAFHISVSKVMQTLDTQLLALDALAKKHAVLSEKNGPLAKNLKQATNTIEEIKRTLIEGATALSAKHSIEAIPALERKIAALNEVLQQTAIDLTAHTRGPVKQAVHNIFGPMFKAIGDFIAWSTGYVSKGVAKRKAEAAVKTQLKANEALTENSSKISLTDKDSPAILTDPPDNSASNLAADFQRALENDELFVNGKPLSDYAAEFNDFEHESDAIRFIQEVILKDVSGNKTPMLQYMKEKFHQDGLFWPVTSAVQKAMTAPPSTGERPYHVARLKDAACTHRVEITSTEKGCAIQETLRADHILVTKNSYQGKENSLYIASEDKVTLSATVEGSPILTAQGTVQVDFSKNAREPTLTTVENSITYGHRVLAEKMEELRENKERMLEQIAENGLTDTELSSRGSTPEPGSDSEEETNDGPPAFR
ncbi:MAG: hypothetical protein P1U32_05605 [Legionellaceae bacterium]|nr:hypothetical protein [Legionellaceae bacterium]